MKKLVLGLIILLFLTVPPAFAASPTVTILHFSDYHSHAIPFYAEGQANMAGIARVLAYLKPFAADPNVLIFNGGDMLNVGAMGWSDKYRCAEWSWFNGITDAMAYGNHDADYGPEVFAQCQKQINYPILGANVLDAAGQPLFQSNGKTYQVFEVNGVKIGVFAIAGADFEQLVKPEVRPAAGATFGDPLQAAQGIVKALHEQEKVNAVVLIGHDTYENNVALAQAVPGIDLILGTHSHRKEALIKLSNTNTFFISPFQYLTYLNRVDLTFDQGKLTQVNGQLVEMSPDLPEDSATAQQVKQMQADLEADPQYAALFQPIGQAAIELSTDGQFEGEGLLGDWVMDIFRERAQAHLAISTASMLRQSLPPGVITPEILRSAMPYPNKIFVFDLPGTKVQEMLDYGISRKGSDFFPQVAGVRFNIVDGRATDIQILADPANPAANYQPLEAAATYKVATSNFVGLVAGGYKDIFAGASYTDTGLEIRDEVTKYLQAHSPVTAKLDGRIAVGAAPAQLPASGGTLPTPWGVPVLGLGLIILGLTVRRRVTR